MDNFKVDIWFLEIDGKKHKLMCDAERSWMSDRMKRLKESGEDVQADKIREYLEADLEARKTASVWYAIFRTPSYKDNLLIKGVALGEVRSECAILGIEPTNDLLEVFERDAKARLLLVKIEDKDGVAVCGWEGVPDNWKQDIGNIVNAALTLSEEERRPLFSGPKAKQKTAKS